MPWLLDELPDELLDEEPLVAAPASAEPPSASAAISARPARTLVTWELMEENSFRSDRGLSPDSESPWRGGLGPPCAFAERTLWFLGGRWAGVSRAARRRPCRRPW